MHLSENSVSLYIDFFVRNIIGFEKEEIKYTPTHDDGDEYLLIAMDRIARLDRQHGRLRKRIWNNVYFIFHKNQFAKIIYFTFGFFLTLSIILTLSFTLSSNRLTYVSKVIVKLL